MSFRIFSVLALFSILFSSCGSTSKINALKPEPDNAVSVVYDAPPSFISLPIAVRLKDIENQVNKYLVGMLYDDKNVNDDNVAIKIYKTAPISLSNVNGKILTKLPLKANIKYRIGTNVMGAYLYDVREYNLNGILSLESVAGLKNWQLSTKTTLKDYNWQESPSVNVLGQSLPITYLVNGAISVFKSKIENLIDETMAKSMDFKPVVLKSLAMACEPIQLNEEYDTWLRIVPEELYSTDARLDKNQVSLNMGLKCQMETTTGSKPNNGFDKNNIVLKPVAKMPDHITANIVATSSYKDASEIITRNFKGEEFGSGSKKVTVQKVNLWHKQGKMVIALDVVGSIDGTIYLTGFPQYNETTKEIFFDKLDYALDTQSKLMRMANWLVSGYVLKKIEENCRYSIAPNLAEGKSALMKYLTNYSPMSGVTVNGHADDIKFQKIVLTNSAILALLNINGDIKINIDGLE